ncbi:DUF4190 domain-containing protein [Thalassobacillus sp. CUG 92003]|uniref:DUF4190 domain-containing protein n=1 Tax=Thalassobacillus sp. CUG 92003 TaxID=2736641 RepID=UPI0015E76758|nr:DUF4190 domain-containing protein [Thalassobacillus sp. CUG 92003]
MSNTKIENPRFNYAATSFTMGILAIIIPFLGLIFGIVGIVTSNKTIRTLKNIDEKGYKTAKAGLICSIIGVIIQLFLIAGVWTFYMF